MISALLRRAASGSGLAVRRPAAATACSSATGGPVRGFLLLRSQPQPQRTGRLLVGAGAAVCALAAYSVVAGQPAKADAALASGVEAMHVPTTNVTIQARLSSPKAAAAKPQEEAAPAAPAEEEGGGDLLMSRHGTVAEEAEAGAPGEAGRAAAQLTDGDEMNEEEDLEETEEDRRYDAVELEETDCPLCHFMRASACGPTWARWEKCIHYHKEKEEDFVGPCSRVTLRLAQCIERHKDTFPPVLRNALLGGGKGGDEDDEIADDELAEGEAQAGAEAVPAPETSAALAATGAAAASPEAAAAGAQGKQE